MSAMALLSDGLCAYVCIIHTHTHTHTHTPLQVLFGRLMYQVQTKVINA